MLAALIRTMTELLDSKKAAYSFVAALLASILHVYFGVPVDQALLLVSPLVAGTVAQAHVDAAQAKSSARIAELAEPIRGQLLTTDGADAEPGTPAGNGPTVAPASRLPTQR